MWEEFTLLAIRWQYCCAHVFNAARLDAILCALPTFVSLSRLRDPTPFLCGGLPPGEEQAASDDAQVAELTTWEELALLRIEPHA